MPTLRQAYDRLAFELGKGHDDETVHIAFVEREAKERIANPGPRPKTKFCFETDSPQAYSEFNPEKDVNMFENSKDVVRTEAAGFLDKRSHYSFAGNLYVFGKDVAPVRHRIFLRSHGFCEMPCDRAYRFARPPYDGIPTCGRNISEETGELDHVFGGRKTKRTWNDNNLRFVCGRCHRARHPQVQGSKKL